MRRVIEIAIGIGWLALLPACSENVATPRSAEGETRVLAYPPPPPGSVVPPPGSFAIRAIHHERIAPLPGIPLGHGTIPRVFGFQIDYAGPKPVVEVFVENWQADQLHSTAVIHSETFGAGEMKASENSIDYTDGKPHSRPRQTFVLRLHFVDGVEERNTHLSVFSFDATEQSFAAAAQSSFYTLQYDRRLPLGTYTPGDANLTLERPEPRPDSEAVEVFRMTKDGGRLVTLLKVRFR